jgi:hypothetical protein
MSAGHAGRTAGQLVCIAVAALAATSATVCAEPPDAAALEAEIARLRSRVAALEAENARLRGASEAVEALERTSAQAVDETFDPATDTTTLSTAPSRLVRVQGGVLRHFLVLRATHPGRARATPPGEVQLVVETAASAGEYRRATALRLVVDGSAEEYAVVAYATQPIIAGRSSGRTGERETVTVTLPIAALDRMAAGHEVRATLGRHEFALTAEQLLAVRAFRRRLTG